MSEIADSECRVNCDRLWTDLRLYRIGMEIDLKIVY